MRVGTLPDSALFATKVGSIRAVTCASPEYLERKGLPATVEDLAGHDAIQFLKIAWTSVDGSLMPSRRSVRLHANDATVACTAAVQGLGITRVPNFMITDELGSGALVEILADYAPEPFPVHLIYMKQGLLPLKVRAFIDWMTPRLRQRLAELSVSPQHA